MATILSKAERPRVNDRPAPTRDLSGKYRVVHGDLLVPLELTPEEKATRLAKGDPLFESLYKGSIVELSHDEADLLLDHGVIEAEEAPRKGQVAMAKAKAKAS